MAFYPWLALSSNAPVAILPVVTTADLRWCESVARHCLARLRLDSAERVTVDDVCAKCGLRMSASAPSGCSGALAPGLLRVSGRGRPGKIARDCQHEVGHVATAYWDSTLPRHPEEAMRWVGLFVEIPRASAIAAARETGFDPDALRERFPGIFLEDIWMRLSCAVGGLAVMVRTRSDARWVANDVTAEEALEMELRVHALADSARSRGRLVEAGEWIASPVDDRGAGGVLVVKR